MNHLGAYGYFKAGSRQGLGLRLRLGLLGFVPDLPISRK